ncbi:MAG: MMPL family transporter [Oceanicoccus sp.]|uniref:efflux RND transporter permease subunit n=1 Tax=Oceanicoccus sp. TaxID=2691044 RepID=UPI002605F2C0|nr:MMPL family transporter [Oceanicoccus sp.]MDG1772526.1 MMPL family transporter [Oceanicoccus sp.]
MSKIFSIYDVLILRRPLLALILSLGLIAWLATHIPNFKLDASADALVLEGDQSLKYSREISTRYASEDFLLVTYQPKQDLLSKPVLAELDKLRTELAALEGVSSVTTILDVPLLASPQVTFDDVSDGVVGSLRNPNIDKELVRKELAESPIYKNLLTSSDGRTTTLQVNLVRDEKYFALQNARDKIWEQQASNGSTPALEAELAEIVQELRNHTVMANDRQSVLVAKVRVLLDNYRDNATLFLGGVPMIATDMISFVKSDLMVFGIGIVTFIIITMSVIFRHLVWVVLPLLSCLLSATFMLGLITLLDWRMTIISSNFVAILLIISLSIAIHLVVRYRELLAANPEQAQQELVKNATFLMIKPCIYTALTTIVAFASLVVSGIRPVIDFGWMMTVGVTASLVITFIVLPTGLLLWGKPSSIPSNNNKSATTRRFAVFTEGHGSLILWGGALLAVVSIFGISQLKVENRFIDYFHDTTEIYQGMEVIDAELGGTIPLEVIIDAAPEPDFEVAVEVAVEEAVVETVIDDGFFDEFENDFGGDDFGDDFSDDFADEETADPSYWFNRAGLSRIEAVHDYLDSLPETGKVLSLATPYKALRTIATGIDDIQLALIQRALPEDINEILIHPYLNEEIDQTRITVRVKETSRTLRRDELLAQVHEHLINDMGFAEEQIHLTGMLVLYNNMLQSLYRSQILTLGAVFIAILAMFIVLFRSLPIALIALAPNILAAGMVLGGMGLAGIPLDIMTVTIAAISVGIAVDDTIHYVHRFRSEFAKDQNYVATMYRCHGSIGKAMFYTSVIIVIGFSVLALSNFNPSIYFGLLTGTAMFAALMGALLLLPQLLITFKPLGPNVELAKDA